MLSSNIDVLINEIFQSFKGKFEYLEKQIEGSCFSFKFVSRLSIRCQKVNVLSKSKCTKSFIVYETKLLS